MVPERRDTFQDTRCGMTRSSSLIVYSTYVHIYQYNIEYMYFVCKYILTNIFFLYQKKKNSLKFVDTFCPIYASYDTNIIILLRRCTHKRKNIIYLYLYLYLYYYILIYFLSIFNVSFQTDINIYLPGYTCVHVKII